VKKKLEEYILHLDNWIPKNILNQTLKEFKSENWYQHTYTDSKTFKPFAKNANKEPDVCDGNNLTHFKKLMDLTWEALNKYIVIDKIGGTTFNGWNGFSKIRFNRYKKIN